MSDFPVWLQGLLAAIIGGAANAGGSWMGLATAKGVGLEVPTLNWKALGIMMIVGALISAFTYLKQSPIPIKTTTTQVTVTKEVTKSEDIGK